MPLTSILLGTTPAELQSYRRSACEAISDYLFDYVCLNVDGLGYLQENQHKARVMSCDLFVSIVGHCYGARFPRADKSVAEVEYGWAEEAGKERIILLATDNLAFPANLREPDDIWQKQQQFRARIKATGRYQDFASPEELTRKLISSILSWGKIGRLHEETTPSRDVNSRADLDYGKESINMPELTKYSEILTFGNVIRDINQSTNPKQTPISDIIARFMKALETTQLREATIIQESTVMNNQGTPAIRILFLAANPKDTNRLRLDEEIRSIDQMLRQAEFSKLFIIEQHWAVRVMDLEGYLLRHRPDIVHFSGHGSSSSEIVLEDNAGNSQPVSTRSLGKLFEVLKDNIKCVVLNACYSRLQAQAIAEHIDCVVGMSKSIGDMAAIDFAAAFYQALGFGRDVKTAFDLGCLQIDLEGLNEQDTPQLISLRTNPRDLFLIKGP